MTIYVDSSFVVSLYLTDQHSSEARKRVNGLPGLWCTPLHFAEWAHAVSQHLFRGTFTPAEAAKMESDFEHDIAAGLWRTVPLPDNVFELCADLARRHGAKLGVRTLDSLHVACALELRTERFWTFDDRQARLAKAEGLKTS